MTPEKLLDQFSTHLKQVITRSLAMAVSYGETDVRPIYLFLALLKESGSIGTEILSRHEITDTEVSYTPKITPNKKSSQDATTIPELNEYAKRALEKAILLAYEHAHNYVGTEHLLYGLLDIEDSIIESAIQKCSVEVDTLFDHIDTTMASASRFPDMQDVSDVMDQLSDIEELPDQTPSKTSTKKRKKQKQPSALEMFTVKLTDSKIQATIDPVIGREKEIDRLIHILCRRTKNNPVLVGEPGVGKTAIVEGLSKRILSGDVPDVLKRKTVLSLDLTLLIAGTIYRGEFEARMKHVIDELATHPDYILFIDEVHNIIGAGSNQGTMDAANILKPALARGQLRCIGATTIDEYTKHISGDPALERRFQAIPVEEPSTDEAISILSGIKKHYESFHDVTISAAAITAAVTLSTKYIHNSFLPDKAIDLIDEAAAAVRATRLTPPIEKKYQELLDKQALYEKRKEEAILAEAFDEAMKWKTKVERMEKKIAIFSKQQEKGPKITPQKVGDQHIIDALARRLGIDSSFIVVDDWKHLHNLEERLRTHVIGQDEAVSSVVRTLRQAHVGLRKGTKPLASFLFVGPSGVGKTKLAKSLARELYNDEKALINLNMSEFSEAHGVSKILGSPAGYIGHKERNHFIDSLKKRPYAVVLFDEFDKAHPDVRKLLLQLLDEGTLTDSRGKKVHFRHAVIILTSTLGSMHLTKNGLGFGSTTTKQQAKKAQHHAVIKDLKETFGVELMSRIQSTCVFSPLQEAHIEKIIRNHITMLSDHFFATKDFRITPLKTAITKLAKSSYAPDTGARHIEKMIDDVVHNLVIDLLSQEERKKRYTLKHANESFTLS